MKQETRNKIVDFAMFIMAAWAVMMIWLSYRIIQITQQIHETMESW